MKTTPLWLVPMPFIQPLPMAENCWYISDRDAHPVIGGNKVRKLAYILSDLQNRGVTDVVTAGAVGSNHVLATSLLAKTIGINTHAVLVAQPSAPYVVAQAKRNQQSLASWLPATHRQFLAQLLVLQSRLQRDQQKTVAQVPVGGSSPLGNQGWAEVGSYIIEQIRSQQVPSFRQIVVAMGTGGTVAGLAAGIARAGGKTPVVGVRVVPKIFANLATLTASAVATLHHTGEVGVLPPLRVEHRYLFGGYGAIHPKPKEIVESFAGAISLEPTYSGRALLAALDLQGPTLFVATATRATPVPNIKLERALANLLT